MVQPLFKRTHTSHLNAKKFIEKLVSLFFQRQCSKQQKAARDAALVHTQERRVASRSVPVCVDALDSSDIKIGDLTTKKVSQTGNQVISKSCIEIRLRFSTKEWLTLLMTDTNRFARRPIPNLVDFFMHFLD